MSNVKLDYQFCEEVLKRVFHNSVVPVMKQQESSVQAAGEKISAADYIQRCIKAEIADPVASNQIDAVIKTYREAMISQIGAIKYYENCAASGQDIAEAFVAARYYDMRLDYIAEQKVPSGTLEYIWDRGFSSSLIGWLFKKEQFSGDEIDRRVEEKYGASGWTKASAEILGMGLDGAVIPGSGFFLRCGIDAAIRAGTYAYDALSDKPEELTISDLEKGISKNILGQSGNVFEDARKANASTGMYKNVKKLQLKATLYHPSWTQDFTAEKFKEGYPGLYARAMKDSSVSETTQSTPQQAEIAEEKNAADQQNSVVNEQTGLGAEPQDTPIVADGAYRQLMDTDNTSWARGIGSEALSDGLERVGIGPSSMESFIKQPHRYISNLFEDFFSGKKNPLLLMLLLGGVMFSRSPIMKIAMLVLLMGTVSSRLSSNEDRNEAKGQKKYVQYKDEPLHPSIKNPRKVTDDSIAMEVNGNGVIVKVGTTAIEALDSGALPVNVLANTIYERALRTAEKNQKEYELKTHQTDKNPSAIYIG